MDQDKGIIEVGNGYYQWIGGHKPGINIKGLASVIFQQLEIADEVHCEKEDEEKTGQGHHYFSPDSTGERIRKPIHSLFN